ncbi:MAG: DUF4340 domain-containing protein, partial [bacterium]
IQPLIGLKAESLRDRRLCDADPARIASLTIRDGEKKLVLERRSEEAWAITEPFRSRADARSVGSLLKGVCALRGDELTGGDVTNVAERLAQEATVRLTMTESAPVRSEPLTNAVPPGGTAAPRQWSYAVGTNIVSGARLILRQEDQGVFRVPLADLVRMLDGGVAREAGNFADPLRYMDRRVFELEVDNIRRLTLAKGGREETVVRDASGNWSVDSPPGARVSETVVTALLGMAGDLTAARIESAASTNVAKYGFSEISPRLTFGLTGTGGIQKTLLLGGIDGRQGVYAMVQGQDVVFVLPGTVADALKRSLVLSP